MLNQSWYTLDQAYSVFMASFIYYTDFGVFWLNLSSATVIRLMSQHAAPTRPRLPWMDGLLSFASGSNCDSQFDSQST